MRASVASILLSVLALSACGGSDEATNDCSVTIAAASSLSQALTSYESRIESAAWCEVEFVFGSSATLAAQITAGAPIDIFLPAGRSAIAVAGYDRETAVDVVSTVAAIWLSNFYENDITTLDDFMAAKSARVGLCVPAAPCGAMADVVLANLGRTRAEIIDTESTSADDLLLKVRFGELDAAIGFKNACFTSTDISCVDIPATQDGRPLNSKTIYVASILKSSPDINAVFGVLTGEKFLKELVNTYGFDPA
jgi:molybdate transport system substrate-binding protein